MKIPALELLVKRDENLPLLYLRLKAALQRHLGRVMAHLLEPFP